MAVVNRALPSAQTKPRPALRLGPVLLGAGLAVVVIALLQVLQTSEATTRNFAIQRLERQKLELDTQVRDLEAEVASLSSITRVQREAQRLGLKPPEQRETVVVNATWPAADDLPLPSRFAPKEQARTKQQDSHWWDSLLNLLPY